MAGVLELDYFDWVDQFKPIKNIQNPTREDRFETFDEDLAVVHFCMAFFPLHVWTEMDGDDGDLFIGNGYHYVNRMSYYITEKPAIPNVYYEVV